MKNAPDWLFLCDGDDRSGLGHVGRCLGYAEMLADAGQSCEFHGCYHAAAEGMIESAGFAIQPSSGMKEMRLTCDWPQAPARGVLVDSYEVDAEVYTALNEHLGVLARLLVLDDFAAYPRYDCDALINFTLGAKARVYPPGPASQHLGLSFFPARRWLRRVRESLAGGHAADEIRKVLIVAGGRDISGVIPAFLSMIAALGRPLELGVLVGDDEAARASVEAWLPKLGPVEIIPRQPDLEKWLNWADVCLCGGGLVKYECLYVGVPVMSLAQNVGQAEDSARMAAEGLIADLGDAADFNREAAQPVLERFLDDAAWRVEMVGRGLKRVGGESGMDGLLPFLA